MNSIRVRLLLSLLAMLVLAALVLAAVTYRNVLGETEALFDYQLRQMALTLRDQGEIPADQAGSLTDDQHQCRQHQHREQRQQQAHPDRVHAGPSACGRGARPSPGAAPT